MRHHLFNLDSFVPAALKILSDTVLQTDRLPHIDDVILLVMHDIDAGSPRQFFQFFLYIKIIIFHANYYTVFSQKEQEKKRAGCLFKHPAHTLSVERLSPFQKKRNRKSLNCSLSS